MDVIFLTTIVVTLFVVFGIATYREFARMETEGYKSDPNAKKYGRDALLAMMQRLFDEEVIPKKEKKAIYKAMYRTIADMESDGIYFSEVIKEEMKKKREELQCEYSGLPSVKSYEVESLN